jgi:S1-C subfamily serine protease
MCLSIRLLRATLLAALSLAALAQPLPVTAASNDVVKVGENRLELPSADFAWVPGLGCRSMLLLHGDRLTVLGADGFTIAQKVTLPKHYTHIAERADSYVALAADPKSVDVIDKKTVKVRKSMRLSCQQFTDLALHPTMPISYVALRDLARKPEAQFVVFNEETGDGHESDDYVGSWIKADPKGRFLIAGYKDIYEAGSRLLVNPDRVDVVPEYGDISWLIRYSLDDEGMPARKEIKEKAGGNAQGIRFSRDGRRVTFLSHVGYPQFSRNLAGWDPTDLKKIPVTYATKDKGTTYDLAYHPMLPLVASPGGSSAVFFHRETGDLEEDRAGQAAAALAGAKVHNIQFSPDGRNLIFHASVGEVHYLVKAPLRLSPAEVRTVEAEWQTPSPAGGRPRLEVTGEKPPLKALEALKGGPGKAMSTRDVGKWFMDSVVVVRGEKGAGTGFVVGSGGYIVTCAHCLPRDGKSTVSYRDSSGDEPQTLTAEPRVVAVDESRDLALLKINVSRRLRPVRIGPAAKAESGERVVVIGNPGLGRQILDYTMTEGIVSSPRRDLDGQSYLQTSAQVNPGSSGAPLFDSHGLVIGAIVLKGRIEGAGFAIPAEDLTEFLLAAASTKGADGKLARLWSDSKGRYIEATLSDYEGDKLKLEKADGHIVIVPPEKLGAGDQAFLRMLRSDLPGTDSRQAANDPHDNEKRRDEAASGPTAAGQRAKPKAAMPAGTRCLASIADSEALIEWLRKNNSLGPRSKLVSDMSGFFEKQAAANQGFCLLLGPRLAKSSKLMLLCGHNDQFFAAELPPALSKRSGMAEMGAVTIAGKKNARRGDQRAILRDLIIDRGEDLDRTKEITGSVEVLDEGKQEGDYAFRLTCLNVELYDQIGQWIQVKHEAERVPLKFAAPRGVERGGPMVLFLEICHYTDRQENEFVSVSNTAATVVNAK